MFLKEKTKNIHTVVNEKRKSEKSWNLFYDMLFYKAFKMAINHFSSIGLFVQKIFFCFASLFAAQFLLFVHDDAKNINRENWEQQVARNDKLQYFFQKKF